MMGKPARGDLTNTVSAARNDKANGKIADVLRGAADGLNLDYQKFTSNRTPRAELTDILLDVSETLMGQESRHAAGMMRTTLCLLDRLCDLQPSLLTEKIIPRLDVNQARTAFTLAKLVPAPNMVAKGKSASLFAKLCDADLRYEQAAPGASMTVKVVQMPKGTHPTSPQTPTHRFMHMMKMMSQAQSELADTVGFNRNHPSKGDPLTRRYTGEGVSTTDRAVDWISTRTHNVYG